MIIIFCPQILMFFLGQNEGKDVIKLYRDEEESSGIFPSFCLDDY